jgi:Tol biopolymer transport system component
MKRLCAAGAVLGLIMAALTTTAEASRGQWESAIAFVSDRDSASAGAVIDEIYLLDPRTGEIQRVTYDLPGVERWPTISPDGRSLAWVRWPVEAGVPRPDLSEIYRCDLRFRAGSWSCLDTRKVVGPVFENAIAWTPDSRTILYSGPVTADFDADVDIYSVDVRSDRTRNLTREAVADGTIVQSSQPTVSPDGRHFVYSRGSTGPTGADLYRRNIDGSDPVQLTAAPRNDIAADYSSDGKRLVFHSNRDGDADIYIMKAAVEGQDNPAVNLTNGLRSTDGAQPSQERAPSFSPDGHQIAFWWFTDLASGGFTDGEIYLMRADGSGVSNLTNNNPTDPAALSIGDIQPDWGPNPSEDGRHKYPASYR